MGVVEGAEPDTGGAAVDDSVTSGGDVEAEVGGVAGGAGIAGAVGAVEADVGGAADVGGVAVGRTCDIVGGGTVGCAGWDATGALGTSLGAVVGAMSYARCRICSLTSAGSPKTKVRI